MGDLNAKIGSINRGFEEVTGQQGLGIVNENGELFLDLCDRMVIGGSISNISAFTRQLGFRPTTRLKTRKIMFVSTGNLDDLCKMYAFYEEHMRPLTIILC